MYLIVIMLNMYQIDLQSISNVQLLNVYIDAH
jgi:hypothetical protein